MPGGGGGHLLKELTLVVDVADNKLVTARSVIESAENLCGEGNVLAVVPRSGNLYEITVKDKDASNELCNGAFQVAGIEYRCHAVYSEEKVVSFLHLPAFISDNDIIRKLEAFGAELKSPIKRRLYRGTNVADGTRYVVVKFPPNVSSLPYTMKFDLGNNKFEYIRVKHDNQSKVCSKCLSDDHLYVDCPENKCYRCNEFGHLVRFCPSMPCDRCEKYPSKCRCTSLDMTVFRREQEEDEQRVSTSKKGRLTSMTMEEDENEHSGVKKRKTANSEKKTDTSMMDDNKTTEDEQLIDNDVSDNVSVSTSFSDVNENKQDETSDEKTNNISVVPCESMSIQSDVVDDDELDLNKDNDNGNISIDDISLGKINVENKGGHITPVTKCNQSVDVGKKICSMSTESCTTNAISTSENISEVDMDDEEMTAAKVKYGGKYRRGRLVVHPNIPYDKRRSVVPNNNTKQV